MDKYSIVRTDLADDQLRKIILTVAQNFGKEVALKKLDEIEQAVLQLAEFPYSGAIPHYSVLRRAGYRVLVLERDLVFYKVDEPERKVIIYAITDNRQDYLSILRGL